MVVQVCTSTQRAWLGRSLRRSLLALYTLSSRQSSTTCGTQVFQKERKRRRRKMEREKEENAGVGERSRRRGREGRSGREKGKCNKAISAPKELSELLPPV